MHTTRFAVLFIATIALVLVSTTASIGAKNGDGSPDLQALVEEFVGLVPGGAVAVTVRDGVTTTAAAGIGDIGGGTVTPDTPFVIGVLAQSMNIVIALQLAEEGRLELDEPVVTFLPDAPIAPEATVRDLLNSRAGVPNPIEQLVELSLADPSHTWTIDEIVGLIDPGDSASVGTASGGFGNDFLILQLIEAIEGSDYPTVLQTRIAGPLGLEATGFIGGGRPAPPGLTTGWRAEYGLFGDPDAELEAMTTIDPRTSTAGDVAAFLTALFDGRLVSDESLQLMFDAAADGFAYGFDGHGFLFGDLGDLAAYYYTAGAGLPAGYWGTIAGDPVSGDIIVVLANNIDLFAPALVRDIASSWAAE